MISIDKIDLQILETFKNLKFEEECTTCDIAKQLFKPKNNNELRTKTSLIERRLKKLSKYGVILIKKRGKKMYMLDDIKCRKALILNLSGDWHTFQL